jgi:hypothetical protein
MEGPCAGGWTGALKAAIVRTLHSALTYSPDKRTIWRCQVCMRTIMNRKSRLTLTKKKARKSSANGVLILECLDKADPGSEGRFLSHMFNLMDVESQYTEIRSKDQLIAMLGANPFDVIHITTHGHVATEQGEFIGFWTPKGTVRLHDFPRDVLQEKIIVSTACLSGITAFAKPFIRRVGAEYYIAPGKGPKFHNAIYFGHWFYHNFFVLNYSPRKAVEKYRDDYKNPHDFKIFSRSSTR